MNKLLIVVLTASLAGPALSGAALANPGSLDESWMVARKDGDDQRQEERDSRKSRQQSGKKKPERIEEEHEDRGYGYGYERRNPDKHYDDRGRH